MKLNEISALLSAICYEIPNAMYLRATDTDANTTLDNVNISGRYVVLFNNLPEVNVSVSQSGYMTKSTPIGIKVLRLAGLDDTTIESDTIRDSCEDVANMIFDKITKDQELPDTFEYSLSFLNEVKLYDKILTGVSMSFVLNTERGGYGC